MRALGEGALYGYRAHGPFDPADGHRFDPSKLLVDPYAVRVDRPFVYHPTLAAPPQRAIDTAPLVPRGVVTDLSRRTRRRCLPAGPASPRAAGAGLYAAPSRRAGGAARNRGSARNAGRPRPSGADRRRDGRADAARAALDERHLSSLGLTNAWGYNPITHMAPDPRLAPGGWPEIRRTVAALHQRGIRVLLDVVLNHSGESDRFGPTLCYRGLDNRTYYASPPGDPGTLVNDTGTGNTFAFWREPVARMGIDALRTWVDAAGIDGFRYDLGTVLARTPGGFDPNALFLAMLRDDPVLKDRLHVMEPWDIGPGGYQVGRFPPPFLEWQDRFRDDVRRFWPRRSGMVGALATRLSGSPDLFDHDGKRPSDGVNFIAAHDGFSLADLVAYEAKHNEANGEANRDGHGENHSWNNGVEGITADPAVVEARRRDVRALMATLMLSRGTPMIVAGDEMGRTQNGNNNGYAQDNETLWLDWPNADADLVAFTARLAGLRRMVGALHADAFLAGRMVDAEPDGVWLGDDGAAMRDADWQDPARHFLGMRLAGEAGHGGVLVYLNAAREARTVALPTPPEGHIHRLELQSDRPRPSTPPLDPAHDLTIGPRSVFLILEPPRR